VKGTEVFLREKGIQVDIKEDQKGIELYARFRTEKPGQDLENLRGLSAVSKKTSL
jgi:cytosine deaminase